MRSVCIALLRWGGWPGWTPLLMRTIELNPSIRYMLIGNQNPELFRTPRNAEFHKFTLRRLVKRIRHVLGVGPGKLSVEGGASKIADFKPMLAEIFSEMFTGCDYWGYMQEDVLLGDLRSFLTESLLNAHDVISPLPAPLYHAGAFMIYRNAPHVNSLFRKSSEWEKVARSQTYLVFDEWWGDLKDGMNGVVQRESQAGRIRAYTAGATRSSQQMWLADDNIYAQQGGGG